MPGLILPHSAAAMYRSGSYSTPAALTTARSTLSGYSANSFTMTVNDSVGSGTIFQDTSQTTAAGSGDPVGSWAGDGANFEQTVDTAYRPTIGTDGSGSLYVAGDGSSDYLQEAFSVTSAGAYFGYAIDWSPETSDTRAISAGVSGIVDHASDAYIAVAAPRSAGTCLIYRNGASVTISSGVGRCVVQILAESTTTKVYLDGSLFDTASHAAKGSFGITHIRLMQNLFGTETTDARIYAVSVADAVPDVSDISTLYDGLATALAPAP